jgi:hypothetical protein
MVWSELRDIAVGYLLCKPGTVLLRRGLPLNDVLGVIVWDPIYVQASASYTPIAH